MGAALFPVWAGAALSPAPAALTAPLSASPDWTAILPSVAIGLVALLLGTAIAFRFARSQARLRDELRQARARADSLEPLLDAWLWQTDAALRFTALQPPPGAPLADWPTTPSASATTLPACVTGVDPGALGALLARGAVLDDLEVAFDPSGARPRPGVLRARPLTDAAGRFCGYVGTFRPRGSAAPAVQAAAPPVAAPADALPPMDDHESFSFTVSHDLRAPIRVVEGFTKIVKEDYGGLLDRVGNDHLDRVLGAAARMNNMIDALLALSKLSSQPLVYQPVNLSQLAGYVVDDLRRQWPERNAQIDIEPDLQVHGDPTLLRVVVENLLGNAWKYTAKSAESRIALTRHAHDPDTFSVSDNGAGFDMRFADRLFGVFQRLHSANDFPGTGVGLASVRRIVRRHGGDIWGEAEVNQGARFHFSLPPHSVG